MKWPLQIWPALTSTRPRYSGELGAAELATLLSKPRAVATKDAAGLITFNTLRDRNGGTSTANITRGHVIHGDIDDLFRKDAFEAGMATMAEAGTFVIAYQTWSSTPEAERWRVLVFLDEPVTPQEYRACWVGMNEVFGGMFDPNAKDAARRSFLPSHPPGQTREVRVINEALWTE